MFERFGDDARESVVQAQEEARRQRHGFIGCEHLLLGLAAAGKGPAAEAMGAAHLELSHLRELAAAANTDPAGALDADALASLGIDLDQVRRATEATFGRGALDQPPGRFSRGHIPFTPRAKKSIELALRETLRLKHREISSGHVLLGILREGNNGATRLIAQAGVSADQLRDEVVRRLTAAA